MQTYRSSLFHQCRTLVVSALFIVSACRQGVPVVDPSARPPTVDGTISGRVVTAAGTPLGVRKLEFVNSATGATHSVSSDANGAFTIKVPPGRYKLKLELRSGEQLEKPLGEIDINRSDLDNNIHVVVRGQG
jgi:Carboxypeptidase regulatory-like domain